MRFLWGSGELSHAPLDALFGLDEIFNLFEDEAGWKVVVGGVFVHEVLGYGGIIQSLHHYVHFHLVRVGGLARGVQ